MRRPPFGVKVRSLTTRDLRPLRLALDRADSGFRQAHPGDSTGRQPVHTVYGGAQSFKADIVSRLGASAIETLERYAPDPFTFATAIGLRERPELAGFRDALYERVVQKLRREPVEDLRIDFEDGYGSRPDAEEDEHAQLVAEEMAVGLATGTLPPFIGIRIKPLSHEYRDRSVRTLDLFVTTLARAAKRKLPPRLVITIPKVVAVEQVRAAARVCALLERRLSLPRGVLKLELMIETPQAILGVDGSVAVRSLVAAGAGRVTAAHFGTYDYTALCGITAPHEHMRHKTCDFARHVMQVALAQTGVWMSDGATNVLPVPPYREAAGRTLSSGRRSANRKAVHEAWRLHYDDIQHSLVNGFYQGWDLHAGQLPTRYAAVYAFLLNARTAAVERLRNLFADAGQVERLDEAFDHATTGQRLLDVFLRGLDCGAITPDEAAHSGVTPDEFRTRSFLAIVEARRAR